MFKILQNRITQGHRTTKFPLEVPALPERYRGRPELDPGKCPDGCKACEDACPSQAISTGGGLKLDLGQCLFCTACVDACPQGAVNYTRDHRMATSRREGLVLTGSELKLADGMAEEIYKILGRAL